MKEIIKTTSVEFDVVNRDTGEIIIVEGKTHEVNKYYSVTKITTRINQMDFTIVLSKIATSVNQLPIIARLLDMIDAENKLLILNQVELAKELGCSRKILSTLLGNLARSELAIKENKNIYHINPYIFIGKRTRSNEAREQLQLEWNSMIQKEKTKDSEESNVRIQESV